MAVTAVPRVLRGRDAVVESRSGCGGCVEHACNVGKTYTLILYGLHGGCRGSTPGGTGAHGHDGHDAGHVEAAGPPGDLASAVCPERCATIRVGVRGPAQVH